MKIHWLKLTNFKGVSERLIEFADSGITVISGPNEIGKSTLISAFNLLLTKKHTFGGQTQKAIVPIGKDEQPVVEAELTLGNDRLKVRKVFAAGKGKAELAYVGGPNEGKKLTGGEASDELEKLWLSADQVLWKAINEFSSDLFAQRDFSSSVLLRQALQLGAGVEDSGLDSSLIDAAAARKREFFTDQKNNPANEYREAITQQQNALADFEAATGQLREVEAGIVRLEDAKEQLDSQLDRLSLADQQLANAKDSLGESQQALNHAELCKQQLVQAQSITDSCTMASQIRQDLITEAENLASELATCTEALAELNQTRTDLVARLQEANEKLQVAQTANEQAKFDLAQAKEAHEYLLASDQVSQLQERIERVNETIDQIAQLKAAAETEISEKLLSELAAAQARADFAADELASGAPTLKITQIGSGGDISIDGHSPNLDSPLVKPLLNEIRLVVDQRYQIDFCPAAASKNLENVAAAQQKMADLLAECQVSSVDQAKKQWSDAYTAGLQLEQAQTHLRTLLAGQEYSELANSLAKAKAKLASGVQTDLNLEQSSLAVDAASELLNQTGEDFNQAKISANQAKSELDLHEARLENQKITAASLQARLAGVAEKLAAGRELASDEKLAADLASAQAQLDSANEACQQADAKLAELDAKTRLADYESAKASQAVISEAVKNSRNLLVGLTGELRGMRAEVRQEKLDQAQSSLLAAETKLDRIRRRAEAAKLLYETLVKFLADSQEQYRKPFTDQINQLGALVYRDQGFKVDLSNDLTINSRRLGDIYVPYGELSAGAKEQLLILVKLAAVMLVSAQEPIPVLLDDLFGHTDPLRQRRMAKALALASQNTQIIILTSDPMRYASLEQAKLVELS